MNIHEYQAKALLREYGVACPEGRVAHAPAQALSVAGELGEGPFVVKAQIHAGGRGKAGGVQMAPDGAAVVRHVDKLLGKKLVTAQTGSAGRLVQRVLVEQALKIERELYMSLVVDRGCQRVVLIASDAGGMDIEEVARHTPERVLREPIDPAVGLLEFQCRRVALRLGLPGKQLIPAIRLMKSLYRLFRERDCLMAEINPLAIVEGGKLMAMDCKLSFDGNAMYRQSAISDLRDFDEEDPKEVEASGHGLNYIALDGAVGCIVNGAGLAMATMDAIALHGGRPANFLDVGGGASPEKVANAFRLVLRDANVRSVLVNIFAGINRCDWVAEGVVQAMRDQRIAVPVIVRLAGTNVAQGRQILAESGLPFITAVSLDDAALRAVRAGCGEIQPVAEALA